MFHSNALLSLLVFVALAVAEANPISRQTGKASLSFARKIAVGIGNIAETDRAHAQALRQGGSLRKRDTYPVDVTNNGVIYVAQVGVGSPPTNYSLIIDTGSSNTWVGAGKQYVKTSTSVDTGKPVNVRYGSGNFTGEEYTDTVTLSSDLVIKEQSIGVATQSAGFEGFDGILGVGPTDLTNGTVSGENTFPTVTDNLFSQGKISKEVLGVFFKPSSDSSSGELTFGGYDESAVVGPILYVPLTKTPPASKFWGINQSISYGSETILPLTSGIVDTGTTLIYVATEAFQKYANLTGGTYDPDTGLLKIDPSQYDNLQPLVFNIANAPFVLSPNAQIWPRSLNIAINGTSDGIYLILGDIGPLNSTSVPELNFINGYTFLERYYSVYDTSNQRVGLAATEYTFSEHN